LRRITRNKLAALPIVAALALVGMTTGACSRAAEDGLAAIVNGYRITDEELERYYQSQVQDQAAPPSEDQAQMMRLSILSEIIDRQILLHEAEKLGLTAVDEEINQRLGEYRAPFANEDGFLASLRDRGMNLEDLRTEIRRNLTIDKLFNRQVASRIKISDAEMRAYYEENRASFALAEQQLHLAQLLVTEAAETPVPNLQNDDATDKESAKAKIQMLAEQLRNGADFAQVAQDYSEDPVTTPNGGDLGFVPQSSLEKADIVLRRVVASLSPGEISPIVETDGQYRIIKLIAREPAGQRDYSDPRVQQTIRETLLNRKDQLLKAALLESARSAADVRNLYAERLVARYGVAD
jgi:peptidyl-prolyl cis-trans isomerase SurA